MKQITLVLTLSEAEDKMITLRYGDYVAGGGKATRNTWAKTVLIKEMKK